MILDLSSTRIFLRPGYTDLRKASNGLAPQTFHKWTKTRDETKPRFVEVPPRVMPPALNGTEILIEKGDVKIHIPLGLGCGVLREVIEGLVAP